MIEYYVSSMWPLWGCAHVQSAFIYSSASFLVNEQKWLKKGKEKNGLACEQYYYKRNNLASHLNVITIIKADEDWCGL